MPQRKLDESEKIVRTGILSSICRLADVAKQTNANKERLPKGFHREMLSCFQTVCSPLTLSAIEKAYRKLLLFNVIRKF